MSKWLTKNNPLYSPFDGSSEHIKVCPHCGFEYALKREYAFCPVCGAYMGDYPSFFTNGDCLRIMTDEELVGLFTAFEYDGRPIFTCPADNNPNCDSNCCLENGCPECFLRWLKQEVTKNEAD